MPEYKKGPFSLLPNPPYEELALHSEVLQIWPTGEIFTNYEQYADRLYQYNQKEWSCKYTGKGQLTFAEAYASEEKARKSLDSFPEAWKGPLLAFIQHSMASIDQICSQFMDFVRTNYIPGEEIKIDFNHKRMKGKIISCTPAAAVNDTSYRVEIFEDESCTELVGEANVIGSGSFSRDRQLMNKTLIKRYAKSVSNRRGPNHPWFISDELAQNYGITTELPSGITIDMKPSPSLNHGKKHHHSNGNNGNNQMGIDDYFLNSSMGFLAEERSVSPPPPQFNFPCDDAMVPVELIDPDLKYPDLVMVNQFISDSNLMTRSLSIWTFCQTFSDQLKLSPFSYDDWEEAICCTDLQVDSNPIIEETFLALLFTLMKDRRNLTKGAFADKIKSAVLTFKSEIPILEQSESDNEAGDNEEEEEEEEDSSKNEEVVTDSEGPEIVISSDSDSEDEDEKTFVKRSKNSKRGVAVKKVKSLILPSIDLRKHRWYETRATEYWHFVLGSFYHEIIDMVSQFAAEERAKEESESEELSESESSSSDENGNANDGNDSAYEEDENIKIENSSDKGNSEDNSKDSSAENASMATTSTASESPLEVMENFIKIYEPIVEKLTEFGSKEMFKTYLNLSLSHKLALLEFLIHNHHDRETFKTFVEECLDGQGESRRFRNEIEVEAQQVFGEVEKLEGQVADLKDENLKITERLEADESDIEMSDDNAEGASDKPVEDAESKPVEDAESKPVDAESKTGPLTPLTETEREELIQKRTANKKEISVLNANLRKLRPEATALNRKLDSASRELRKCSSFRTFPLGTDRHSREYWWFGDFNIPLGRIFLLNLEHNEWLGAIDSESTFKTLMDWLNPLGIREAKLKAALMEIEKEIVSFLNPRDLPDSMILKDESDNDENCESESEVDFDAFRRSRGRPSGTSANKLNTNLPTKRPFQKYKNSL